MDSSSGEARARVIGEAGEIKGTWLPVGRLGEIRVREESEETVGELLSLIPLLPNKKIPPAMTKPKTKPIKTAKTTSFLILSLR
jgi:hypothetical protein